MKLVYPLIIFTFLMVHLSAQEISYPERDEDKSSFELVIEGISEIKGEVRIAVFDSEKSYGDKENPLHAVILDVESDTVVWNDVELPFGEYAIAVYHDKNVNGKLDSNFLGIPKEAYGFSNNARGKLGPASWKDAHFSINEKRYYMSIKVD